MDTGPGRFANASQFQVIARFFSVFQKIPYKSDGYSKTELFDLFGMPAGTGTKRPVFLAQSRYDDGSDNYFGRAYIWESTGFQIHKDTRFFVSKDPEGPRYISAFGIEPYYSPTTLTPERTDNFDFQGGSITSDAANYFLKPAVDPNGIGRIVNISFTEPRTLRSAAFTFADYEQARATTVQPMLVATAVARIAANANGFVNGLFAEGATRLLDSNSRPIIYGAYGKDDLLIGSTSVAGYDISKSPLAFTQPLATYVPNGIAYVAGTGTDVVQGTSAGDYIDGGTGDDMLKGGLGFDTYAFKTGDGKDIIEDSDGLGEIKINGNKLTGASNADYRLEGNKAVWNTNNGEVVYTLNQGAKLLVISGSKLGGEITIRGFDIAKAGGYLGLKLDASQKVALFAGSAASVGANPTNTNNVWGDKDFTQSKLDGLSSRVAERTGRAFVVNLARAAEEGDTLVLSTSGLGGTFKAILGDRTVAANGAVINLVAGETTASFALIGDGEITSDLAGQVSLSYWNARHQLRGNLHDKRSATNDFYLFFKSDQTKEAA
jgi:hypothetical protein